MVNNETIQKARAALSRGAFDESQAILETILSQDAADFEARYALAVLHRAKKQNGEAKRILLDLLSEKPDFGRGFQELAYCEAALDDQDGAQTAFERAVELDASLLNSWKYLAKIYEQKRDNRAEQATKQAAFLGDLPDELRTVISYLAANRLADAERLCRFFMKQNKTHIEGMRLMAEVATRTGVFEDAEFLLETAVELQPDHMDAELQLIHILLRRQRFHKAYERAKALCQKHKSPPQQALALSASACFGVGENTKAIQIYEQMIEASPHDSALKVSLAHIYNAIGSTDHAIALFKEAYQLNASFGDAYWSLANTKSYRFSEEEITAMTEGLTSERAPQLDQIQMHFALGKAHEDQQKFERSFDHYAKGNALKQKTSNHSAEQLDIRVSTQIDVCTKDLFEQKSGVGHTAQDPIFIVGLPRAGSTLLEQILASHSMVDGTMELHDILDLAKRLRGRDKASDPSPRYPRILQELGAEKFTQFGKQFIADTRAYRGSAPRFIDKMPNNFFHVGLIKLILPRAKIIDARRHPMSCCFSGLKQLFGEGQEFSYGQEEIGNYYKQYVRLMDHWDKVLPGFVLRVQHEEVVEDLDKQVRRLLDFCELPFEEDCLNFHKTERSVRTPSAEQVRQPIYRSGLDQWRNFEQFLNPLKHALGADLLDNYGITPPQ